MRFSPDFYAALEKDKSAPWAEPNNNKEIFAADHDPDRLRKTYAIRKTDETQAFKDFLSLAEEGSIYSMAMTGHAFLTGTGTKVDTSQAELWLNRAFENGDEFALFCLAQHYNAQKRYADAETILKDAVTKSQAPALYLMAFICLHTGRKKQAKEMFERAVALGHSRARWTLTQRCIRGTFGITAILRGFQLMELIYKDTVQNVARKSAIGQTKTPL